MPRKGNFNIHLLVAFLGAIGITLFAVIFLCAPERDGDDGILPPGRQVVAKDRQVVAEGRMAGSDAFVIDDPLGAAPVESRPLEPRTVEAKDRDDRASGRIRARIVDTHTGRPVAAFKVWIDRESGELADGGWTSRPGELVRNQFGILERDGVDKGTWALLIRCPGYEDLLVPGLVVPQKEELLTIGLSRGTHIRGTVIDSHGDPVRNARVIVKSLTGDRADPGSDLIFKKTTNRDGFYLVAGLTPGAYDIFLESTDEPADCRRGLFVAAGSGLTIDLIQPVHNRIEFQICSVSGAPLNKASVRLYGEGRRFNAATDAEGRAVLERIPEGTYTLSVIKGGFYPLKEEFLLQTPEGTHGVDKKLEPTPRKDG